MPNTHIPYDLKTKDLMAKSVQVTWDVHNTIEFMSGTTYDVVVSTDGGVTHGAPISTGRRDIVLPLLSTEFHFAVRSVSPVLGISLYSPFCLVKHKIGSTDAQNPGTIAVSESGSPSKLIVDASGALKIGGTVSVNGMSDVATEVTLSGVLLEVQSFRNTNSNYLNSIRTTITTKADEIFNNITASRTAIVNKISDVKLELDKVSPLIASLIDKVDDVSFEITDVLTDNQSLLTSDLAEIKTKLDHIKLAAENSNKPSILFSEIVLPNVDAEGVTVFIPWKSASIINRVTVIKEFGSATSWKIEILNKGFPITQRNVVMRENSYESYDPDRYDILRTFSFVNVDGNDLVGIRLTPDTGTSNIFYVCITGTEAQY